MIGRMMVAGGLAASGLALLLTSGAAAERPRGAVDCSELNWSEAVLAANPDIALACQGVYEKDGVLYAKATIEVVRVQGNSLKFRTLRTDGSLGKRRSVTLDSAWRVNIGGRVIPLNDLVPGQRLSIYLPEDRFSLTVLGSNAARSSDIEADED